MPCAPLQCRSAQNVVGNSQPKIFTEFPPALRTLRAGSRLDRCHTSAQHADISSRSGICSGTRSQLVLTSELYYFKAENDSEKGKAASSNDGDKQSDSADAAEDAADSTYANNSGPPSGPPPPSVGEVFLRQLLTETVTDVALPGTLAIIAAYLLRLDAFGHFSLTYSAASAAILAAAPWCFARIVLLLSDFAEPTSASMFSGAGKGGFQPTRVNGDNIFILSPYSDPSAEDNDDGDDSKVTSASKRSHRDSKESSSSSHCSDAQSPAAADDSQRSERAQRLLNLRRSISQPLPPFPRLKAALHRYQGMTVSSRTSFMLAVEVPLLLCRQFVVEMLFRAVGLAFIAGWLTDRLYEAGAEPTATSSVAMQAIPLIIFVGASFFVGAAGVQIQKSRKVMQNGASLLNEFVSNAKETRARKKRATRLNSPEDSSTEGTKEDDMASKLEAAVGALVGGKATDGSLMDAQLQRMADYTVLAATCRLANFSLMSSVFLTTGNMAASWVAGVMVAGTDLACKGVRKGQLQQREADTISNMLMNPNNTVIGGLEEDAEEEGKSGQDRSQPSNSEYQPIKRKTFRERRREGRGKKSE